MSTQTLKPTETSTIRYTTPEAEAPGQISMKTLSYIVKVLNNISKGDFTTPIDSPELSEAMEVIPALKNVQTELSKLAADILQSGKSFELTSGDLNNLTKTMLDKSVVMNQETIEAAHLTNEMSTNMNNVSAATEELSANMKDIANNSAKANESVAVISSSTNELTSASREIAQNTERARHVSNEAVQKMTEANERVSALEKAASEINEVTSAISEISDQTKLLALNATIEAARAGEAGRGFAVVASEVKDLASQTNEATKNIQKKISVIQSATKTTIDVIATISKVMEDVNHIVEAIAAAAEEQSATTQTVASNINQTTELIKDMANSVKEGSLAVQEINKNIMESANLASEAAQAIGKVKNSTQEIKESSTVVYATSMEAGSVSDDLGRRLKMLTITEDALRGIQNTEQVLFKFTPAYSVNIKLIDEQHEVIFNYINQIHKGIKQRKTISELARTIKELAQFTVKHFAQEEEYMTKYNYPDYQEHKGIHTNLLKKVNEVVTKIDANEEVDLVSVLIFLKDWLQVHILKVDRKYSPFLNERGIQ